MTPIFMAAECTNRARRECALRRCRRRRGRAVLPLGSGRSSARQRRVGVEVHEHVPARLDGLDPLRRVAQRHARRLEQVGLLLHAAGVGEDGAGVARELRGSRGSRAAASSVAAASSRSRRPASSRRFAVRGWSGKTTGPGRRSISVDEPLEPVRVVDVPGAVRGHEQVAARLDAGVLERARALGRDRREGQRHVGHHVADQVRPRLPRTPAPGSPPRSPSSRTAGRSRGR